MTMEEFSGSPDGNAFWTNIKLFWPPTIEQDAPTGREHLNDDEFEVI